MIENSGISFGESCEIKRRVGQKPKEAEKRGATLSCASVVEDKNGDRTGI